VDTSTLDTITPSTSLTGPSFFQTCTGSDYAGNSVTATSNSYTVESGTRSGSGSGSSSTATFWTAGMYSASEDQFVEGFTRETPQKQRVKIRVGDEDHYVGIIAVTASAATINVSSTPQQAVLSVGSEKKFEVTGDNYYDVFVRLNSINGTKANVTIQSINELIPQEQDSSASGEEVVANEGSTDLGAAASQPTSTVRNPLWIWIVGLVVLVLIFGGVFYFSKNKKRRKMYGF